MRARSLSWPFYRDTNCLHFIVYVNGGHCVLMCNWLVSSAGSYSTLSRTMRLIFSVTSIKSEFGFLYGALFGADCLPKVMHSCTKNVRIRGFYISGCRRSSFVYLIPKKSLGTKQSCSWSSELCLLRFLKLSESVGIADLCIKQYDDLF